MRSMADARTLRVAQWATGTIGSRSLRAVVEHPRLELVAVHVHGADKVGRDAAELAHPPLDQPTGVRATSSLDGVLAARPDCVLYMPLALDLDDVCALLSAGVDVVTTRGELHRPASMPADKRDRVESACAAGDASIHSTGSSPGFITEAVPVVLASIQRRLDRLAVHEYADMSRRPSPQLLFDVMGFGRPPGEVPEGRLQHGLRSFGPSLQMLADELGLAVDDVQTSGAFATATHDLEIAAGPIAAGTVAAQRTDVRLLRAGVPVLTFTALWYVTRDLDEDWDLRDTGWRIEVVGDAPLDVDLRFPFPLEQMADISPAYTANRAVNAVEVVCAAAPGIRTTLDLPQVVARHLRPT